MSSIQSVSLNDINSVKQAPAFTQNPSNSAPVENKSGSTTKKILIGAGGALALAGVVFGGIRYAKKAKFTKALNKISNEIGENIKLIKEKSFLKDKFDFSKVNEELSTVVANAKKAKNLDELKQLKHEYTFADCLMTTQESVPHSITKICAESYTKEAKILKKLFEEKGDFVQARKIYIAELDGVQKRHYRTNSLAAGKTAQGTINKYVIEKLLPEGVKPHTYDISKEMDLATVNYTPGGGYTEYMVRKNKTTDTTRMFTQNCFAPYNIDPTKIKSTSYNPLVSSFKDGSGTNVVSLKLPKVGALPDQDPNIAYYISAGNKNGVLTPLQKDLIEVGARLNEGEVQELAKLLTNKTYMDYDAILSLIQHYAKDAEFMARAAKS